MKSALLIGILILSFAANVWALLPPKYLSVPNWKNCVATERRQTAEFYCLPKHKPTNCSTYSWKKLTHKHLMSYCRR